MSTRCALLQPAARRREGAEHIQSLSVTSSRIPLQSRHTPTWPGHPAHFFLSLYGLIYHGPRAVRTRRSPRRAALLILAHFRHSTQAALPLHLQHSKYKRTTSAITAMIADIRYFEKCVWHEDDPVDCCLFFRILVGCQGEYSDFFPLIHSQEIIDDLILMAVPPKSLILLPFTSIILHFSVYMYMYICIVHVYMHVILGA